jgi:manganese/zinc/iron transport system ATP- binding protein
VGALVGPNGAGKTTLLRALLGTVPPSAGRVSTARPLGYMPQLGPGHWDFPLTALDVALQGSYRELGWLRRPSRRAREAALHALAAVGMEDLAERQIGELSGGQRQRVLLARALVQAAPLTLLDEPLSGADAATESLFGSTLARLRDAGRTVLISTHDLGWAAAHCDLMCLLARRLVAQGPPAEVLTPDALRAAYGRTLVDVGGVTLLSEGGCP